MFKSVENDSGLMPQGEYEVYVQDCCFSKTKNGAECIKFEFVVRSDIEQVCKGRHMFKQFYRDRDTGRWPEEKIGKYANALGIPKDQDFELDDLIARNCVMVVKHYQDNQTGEMKDCIFYLKSSRAGSYVSNSPGDFEEIGDEGDLPF